MPIYSKEDCLYKTPGPEMYNMTNATGHKYLQNHPGGRLNKKDGLTRYGDSHVKDKTS